MKHQDFDGIRFYIKPDGYYKADHVKYGKSIYIHRYKWEKLKGEIPNGFHIHHINGDKSDNSIENLELISASKHSFLHFSEREESNPRWWEDGLTKAREAARLWHKSEEGKTWHSEQARNSWINRKSETYKCTNCNGLFTALIGTYKQAKGFCKPYCKTAYRVKSGVDDEQRSCVVCSALYKCNKYVKKKTCSRLCASELQKISKKGQ